MAIIPKDAVKAQIPAGTERSFANEDSYGRLVSFLARSYQNYLDVVVASYGISSAHVPLLSYLWSGNSGDTQNDIARHLGVDKGTVSRNVSALVKLGLVSQTASSRDSRACVVELTDLGWTLAEPVGALANKWSDEVVHDMNDVECQQLLGGLRVMCQHADKITADAHAGRFAVSASGMTMGAGATFESSAEATL